MEEFKVKTIDATDFLKTGTECMQRTIYDRNKEDKEDKERESRRPLNINLTINFTNQKADNLVNVHQNTGDIDIAQQHTWVEQPVEPAEEVFEELNVQPEGEECGMAIEENDEVKLEETKVQEAVDANSKLVRPIDQKVQKALLQIIEDGRIKYAYDYHVIMEILRSKYDMKFDNAQQFSDYMHETLGITHKAPKADNLNTYLSKMRGEYPKWTWEGKDERFASRCIKIANFFIHEMDKLQK